MGSHVSETLFCSISACYILLNYMYTTHILACYAIPKFELCNICFEYKRTKLKENWFPWHACIAILPNQGGTSIRPQLSGAKPSGHSVAQNFLPHSVTSVMHCTQICDNTVDALHAFTDVTSMKSVGKRYLSQNFLPQANAVNIWRSLASKPPISTA